MTNTEAPRRMIRLLDISGIFWPIWRAKEAAGKQPREASDETVRILRERASAAGADHVVACCDSGRSFRHAIGLEWRETHPDFKGYKAHRPAKDPALMAAMDRVVDNLAQDGVAVLKAEGFEADDIIATLATWGITNGYFVEVVSGDKDLQALACDVVNIVKPTGEVVGPDEVRARFGVDPHRLSEYLAIVGDTSDNVPGVKGLGDKAAQSLIAKHGGYLEAVKKARAEDMALANGTASDAFVPEFTQAQRTRLIEGEAAFRISMRMTALRTDVPIDFATVTAPRIPRPAPQSDEWKGQRARAANINATIAQEEEESMSESVNAQTVASARTAGLDGDYDDGAAIGRSATPPKAAPVIIESPQSTQLPAPVPVATQTTALALPKATATRGTRNFEMELEPRSYEEAMLVAEHASDSKHFKDIATPPQALMLMLLGRKFGLSAVDSLRMIHMIEGKPSMSAQLIVGIVQKSGMAEYFEIDSLDNTGATWITKRKGARKEQRWTFSVEDAKTAKLGGFGKKEHPNAFDPNSNWAKHPRVMCMWRAAVFLARAVYTDLVGGLYMPDELHETEAEIDGNPPTFGTLESAA